jgi:hypothetical protein
MNNDHFTRYQPRSARSLPLTAGEVYEAPKPWPRALSLAVSFVVSGALWTAIIIAICVFAAVLHT